MTTAKEQPKARFRDYFIRDTEYRLKSKFDSLGPIVRAKEMTRFYVKSVVSRLTPGLVPDSDEEIDDYIVDGPNDGGADFIYPSDGRVLIVQSKYRGPDKHEDAEDFTHFCEVIERLYGAYLKKTKLNSKVVDALEQIDWDSDYFELHFATLGKVSDALRTRADKGPTPVTKLDDFEERVELFLYDEQDLNIKLREALSAGEVIDQAVDIRFKPNQEGVPWIRFESDHGRSLYVGEVSGSELAEMYQQHRYRLFAMNIRDYVGESKTNKGIVESTVDNADSFVFFNNGVSAVATQIELKDTDTLTCRRFSIINGAQTVRSLSKAKRKPKSNLQEVRVLLRIMDFSLAKDADFLTDVTRYNNTQNAIKVSDFRSNDPVQKDLNRRFAGLHRLGKPFAYKNKRSREPVGGKIAIGMEDFAKSVHAFRYGPDDMFGGTKYLFDISKTGGYLKVFGDPISHLDEEQFRLLAGTYFLCDEVHSLWKQQREQDKADAVAAPGLERRWILYYGVGELLRLIYTQQGADLLADLKRLSKPSKWMDDGKNRVKGAIADLVKLASKAITRAYSIAAKHPDFRHRNWFRTTNTLTDIKTELEVIPQYRASSDWPMLASTHDNS